MTRGNFKFMRSDYADRITADRVNWLDALADNLAARQNPKSAVEVARQRGQQSIMDQINAIVGNTSRHATVDSVVQEMQERTGLKDYLNRNSASHCLTTKMAQESTEEIFSDFNTNLRQTILNFIKNKVETHRGLVAIPALQEDILTTFKREGLRPHDVNTEAVARYINSIIVAERRKNPINNEINVNIGRGVGVQDMDDADDTNSDFFKGLMSNKG